MTITTSINQEYIVDKRQFVKEIIKILETHINKMNLENKDSDPGGAGWIENECEFFNEFFIDNYDQHEFRDLSIQECIDLLTTKSSNYLLHLKKFIIEGGTSSDEHWEIVNTKRDSI